MAAMPLLKHLMAVYTNIVCFMNKAYIPNVLLILRLIILLSGKPVNIAMKKIEHLFLVEAYQFFLLSASGHFVRVVYCTSLNAAAMTYCSCSSTIVQSIVFWSFMGIPLCQWEQTKVYKQDKIFTLCSNLWYHKAKNCCPLALNLSHLVSVCWQFGLFVYFLIVTGCSSWTVVGIYQCNASDGSFRPNAESVRHCWGHSIYQSGWWCLRLFSLILLSSLMVSRSILD